VVAAVSTIALVAHSTGATAGGSTMKALLTPELQQRKVMNWCSNCYICTSVIIALSELHVL
jgi:hypothetical protein